MAGCSSSFLHEVKKSARLHGRESITINGEISRNLLAYATPAGAVNISTNATVHGDAKLKGNNLIIEGRIKELEGVIGLAEVIDTSKMSGAIKFGATVTLVDEDTDEEKTWQIVGEHEASVEKGLLNIKSPIARALIGKEEGDSVEVRTPGGDKAYEVLKIAYV